ncbi:MAG: hypothetical protein CSB47_06600 [Proteobacteria bacterium]|nr:MAG: hypothetical protein CSB47_06600 [Pseudomonadota bacterium]
MCSVLIPVVVSAVHPSIKISDIYYSGSGCPRGSVSVSMTPNKRAISAVFDRFFTSFSGVPSQRVKRCRLSMSLHVPSNKRVRLRQVRFRGFVDLPKKSSAKIVRNYRFGGSVKQFIKTWQGESFKIINQREPFSTKWSQCGKGVRLEIDSMTELKTYNKLRSQVGVDSFDHLMKRDYRGERGWRFVLDYASC